jgi:hypothetical protein
MKVMLLADSISPDRGKSGELKQLRHTTFTDPDAAISMLLNALHHSVLRGHGQNSCRQGVEYDPFRPRVAMLKMYRLFGPDGMPSDNAPSSLSSLSGLEHTDHNPYGTGTINLNDELVSHILHSAFNQIDESSDKDKPEAFATWLTARNRAGTMFRNLLPSIWPVVWPRYGELIQDAKKEATDNLMSLCRILPQSLNLFTQEAL